MFTNFLKRFGIIIYVGKRLYDIELMKIELQRLLRMQALMELAFRLFRSRYRFREHKQELNS